MPPRAFFLLLMLATSVLTGASETNPAATDERRERIAAAFLLALGRTPSADETAEWANGENLGIADVLTHLRTQLRRDAGMRRATATRAWHDALGRAPTEDELRAGSGEDGARAATYTELMQRHVARLRDHPADYEAVIARAYPVVIHRDVYPEEIAYWKKHGVLPYALLVAAVDHWARRNQPGLMVTSGRPTVSVNSEFLVTVRLSPTVADEARAARAEAPGDRAVGNDATLGSESGHTVIAAGAEHVQSAGRIHFVAAGDHL